METAPVFVKIEEFKELTRILKTVDSKIKDIEKNVSTIKALRDKEAEQLVEWDGSLEDVKTKIAEINNELFQ